LCRQRRAQDPTKAAIAIAAVGAVTILGALILQYGFGLQPCPLCLEQRYAYYFAIPLALMVLVGDHVGASRKVLFAALVASRPGLIQNNSGLPDEIRALRRLQREQDRSPQPTSR
jgi:disulfide bond formation protein DsbB